MRTIKSAADLSSEPIKVLGFTSALANEGKSTTAAACALLAAQMRARVILVDCDLRNPALTNALSPGSQQGILEVISGKKQLEEVLWRDFEDEPGLPSRNHEISRGTFQRDPCFGRAARLFYRTAPKLRLRDRRPSASGPDCRRSIDRQRRGLLRVRRGVGSDEKTTSPNLRSPRRRSCGRDCSASCSTRSISRS